LCFLLRHRRVSTYQIFLALLTNYIKVIYVYLLSHLQQPISLSSAHILNNNKTSFVSARVGVPRLRLLFGVGTRVAGGYHHHYRRRVCVNKLLRRRRHLFGARVAAAGATGVPNGAMTEWLVCGAAGVKRSRAVVLLGGGWG